METLHVTTADLRFVIYITLYNTFIVCDCTYYRILMLCHVLQGTNNSLITTCDVRSTGYRSLAHSSFGRHHPVEIAFYHVNCAGVRSCDNMTLFFDASEILSIDDTVVEMYVCVCIMNQTWR